MSRVRFSNIYSTSYTTEVPPIEDVNTWWSWDKKTTSSSSSRPIFWYSAIHGDERCGYRSDMGRCDDAHVCQFVKIFRKIQCHVPLTRDQEKSVDLYAGFFLYHVRLFIWWGLYDDGKLVGAIDYCMQMVDVGSNLQFSGKMWFYLEISTNSPCAPIGPYTSILCSWSMV